MKNSATHVKSRSVIRRYVSTLLTIVLVGAAVTVGGVSASQALSGSDFQAGNIISDANFYNASAMSQADIQSFLNAQEGTCGNNNCLRLLTTGTSSRAADQMCNAYTGAASESASTIIFKVQQACGISAKVLLVTLQKEQALVTAKAPSSDAIARAMGFACPDDPTHPGQCDPTYAGFYNQLYRAAWQLKRYGNPPGTSNFFNWIPVGGHANILYQANMPSCGSSSVYIQNKATAALYYYTPYQPDAAALASLSGGGDACSAFGNRNFWVYYNNWFGSPTGASPSPIGNFELGSTTINTATFRGWTLDPDTSAPIDVNLYVNGNWGGAFNAAVPRGDVGAAYPGAGANHGFEFTVPVGLGTFQACIYAINVGAGVNQLLGCKNLSTPSGPPTGNLEASSIAGNSATLVGWALDPDAPTSIPIDVYVNGGWGGEFTANGDRPDVGAVYSGYGAAHGFHITVPVGGGVSQVCAYAINIGGGYNVPLGCRSVTAPTGPPIGNFESLVAANGQATLQGWTLDPDAPTTPLPIHVYVNGAWGGAFVANTTRDDIASAFPGYGSAHGFQIPISLPGGTSQVCVYAINQGPGTNPSLGCKTVVMPSGSPFGHLEAVTPSNGQASLVGWAIDPDAPSSIAVHVYVNGAWGGAFVADGSRPDVAAVYPSSGAAHGFQMSVPIPPGSDQVCAYGINIGVGYNQLIGCQTVTG
ncbi:MAG: hypothetical protein JWM49_2988 [Microbacteriaceae bacterium]|nr:hypothetical protein [Microbacteriaceae bacterium]